MYRCKHICSNGNESFTFIVSPTENGEFETGRAGVEYKYGTEGDITEVEGFSTSIGALNILSAGDFEKQTNLYVVRVRKVWRRQ